MWCASLCSCCLVLLVRFGVFVLYSWCVLVSLFVLLGRFVVLFCTCFLLWICLLFRVFKASVMRVLAFGCLACLFSVSWLFGLLGLSDSFD